MNGDPQLVYPLYEMIFNNCSSVEFRPKDQPLGNKTMMTMSNFQLKLPDPVILGKGVIKPVGFGEDEGMLPYTDLSFAGYRLLTFQF